MSVGRAGAALGLALALVVPRDAAADPPAKGAAATDDPRAAVGAFARVAEAAKRGLGKAQEGALVVVAPVTSDVPGTRGDALAARLAAVVAGRVGGEAHARALALPAALAAARARGTLVHVVVEIARGRVRATLDVYPARISVWERLKGASLAPLGHAFAEAPLDAEVRSYMPPIVLERTARARATAKHGLAEVLAAACVEHEGGPALALLEPTRLVLARRRGAALETAAELELATRLRPLPVPLREPLGAVVALPDGGIAVGTTSRGGATFDAALATRATFAGLPVAPGECLTPRPAAGGLDPLARPCEPGAGAARSAPVAEGDVVVAAAVADVVTRDGAAARVVATRGPSGTLVVTSPSARASVDAPGTELAVGDLDLDGVPEVAYARLPPRDDARAEETIVVASLRDGALEPRFELPAPRGVRALALCGPEAEGRPALVAVVADEVWFVR